MESEREPLLASEDGRRTRRSNQVTPLPKLQMLVLCFLTFSEPISVFIIFPFVNEMIVHVGATDDPQKIGYFSGLIESLFYITAFCTVLFWGTLSDKVGRRPVLLIGVAGIIISAIAFGMSETFTAMVISRCINGLINGNAPVIRSVVGEITEKTNESLGFSLISLCWATGAIIAPALGGLLARPAETFPSVFGNVQLFKSYPYLLPCLVGASVSIMGLVTGMFWLKETLGTKKTNRRSRVTTGGHDGDVGVTSIAPSSDVPIPAIELLRMKDVRDTLIASWLFALISVGLEAVWLLWLYTPIHSGGIGMTTFELGVAFSAIGVINVAGVFIFPSLQKRFGSRFLFITAMWLHLVQVVLFPVVRSIVVWESGSRASYVAHPAVVGSELSGPRPGIVTVVGVGIMVVAKAGSDMAFPSIGLLTNSVAPNAASLGAVNGLMSMISCLMRAIGPVASTTIFAATVSENLLGGNLFWIVLLAVGLVATYASIRLDKTPLDLGDDQEEDTASIQRE